jgi:hypothetical protein
MRMLSKSTPDPSVFRGPLRLLAVLCLTSCGAGAALAAECFPYCDYSHNYGPYDFTYVRPGLYGYPLCNARGNCLPNLAYSTSGQPRRGNVEVRFPARPRSRPLPR